MEDLPSVVEVSGKKQSPNKEGSALALPPLHHSYPNAKQLESEASKYTSATTTTSANTNTVGVNPTLQNSGVQILQSMGVQPRTENLNAVLM